MVDKRGKKAYPQVKSGSVSLKADDYMEAIRQDATAEVYLFSISEFYIKNNCDRIHFLYKSELEEFMREYKDTLPILTYNWINLCGFFD